MTTKQTKAGISLEYIQKLTQKTKHGDQKMAETISQIVSAVRDPGKEDFHGLAAGMVVAIMLLQEENDILKTQVQNLANLIVEKI